MDLEKPIWKTTTMVIASSILFVLGALRIIYPHNDFTPVYQGAVCIWHSCNPYSSGELLYPPSTLLAVAPLAFFSYRTASCLWFLINFVLFVVAANLIVALCPKVNRWVTTLLVAIFLAGSSQLLILGQPSAIAISLLAIALYCLLQRRYSWLGVVLLVIGLAIKPQVGGFIILYLLLTKAYRRYAFAACLGAALLLVCGGLVLSSRSESSHWVTGLRANLSSAVAPGATDDPRPTNEAAVAALNLQTVTSAFFQEPKEYNDLAYAVVGILFLAWAAINLRANPSIDDHLVSIGTLSILTLLPLYHRAYDSRILILTIPAAVVVLQRRRVEGILLCILTASAIVSFQHWIQSTLQRAGLLEKVMGNKLLLILLLRESDVRLLLLTVLILISAFRMRRDLWRQASSGQLSRGSSSVAALSTVP